MNNALILLSFQYNRIFSEYQSQTKARKLNWNTLPQRATRSYTATFPGGVAVDH